MLSRFGKFGLTIGWLFPIMGIGVEEIYANFIQSCSARVLGAA